MGDFGFDLQQSQKILCLQCHASSARIRTTGASLPKPKFLERRHGMYDTTDARVRLFDIQIGAFAVMVSHSMLDQDG